MSFIAKAEILFLAQNWFIELPHITFNSLKFTK